MELYQSELLMVGSRLLSYPTTEDKKTVINCIGEMNLSEDISETLKEAVDTIFYLPLKDLQETYVATFDLKTRLGLYLSAHEFGDSPKRGAALIKLQKIINEAGYERIDGELADYIPMLYEFVANMSEGANKDRLIKRLACVTQRILDQLPEENPYRPFFSVLMQYVFEPPTKKDLMEMEQDKEEADLEELPYPIMYQ
ncbi:nitrate reductase molybdenum cofactor assembly chaperone [Saliterribacillus persicus]|uniref:Respiratory nitrate reductase chaperone NarJ n=1 Tax=Saliterribacillus persicus TaxID=930114 RepID=A0A368XG97_9BACI|nr:nitrate reductase molybdenum cofactor assembly chaperone [Saliterribacillus persicus]RCW67021.1 respiratory nitrate reductase chaperone NarJ [Saliterribacillus persicus]